MTYELIREFAFTWHDIYGQGLWITVSRDSRYDNIVEIELGQRGTDLKTGLVIDLYRIDMGLDPAPIIASELECMKDWLRNGGHETKPVDKKEEQNMNLKKKIDTRNMVKLRNGDIYKVDCDYDGIYLIGSHGWYNSIDDYNENLNHRYSGELDIMEIRKNSRTYYCPNRMLSFYDNLELIWKREDPKEMTVAEIEKELGYSVKIIKEEK